MNYKSSKKELIFLIKLYIERKKRLEDLQNYSWRMIDEYAENELTDRSTDPRESIFWFAIWQIQHLANKEHQQDGTLERELKITLRYLENPQQIPPGICGLPPPRKQIKKPLDAD